MPAADTAAEKAALRGRAEARRKAAHRDGTGLARIAAGHVLAEIGRLRGRVTVGCYVPFRSEIDTLPLMRALTGLGTPLCLPVVAGPGLPLRFRSWNLGEPLAPGAFGVMVPDQGEEIVPNVLIVPLLAYDDACTRLGYGGGFYDRTIGALRENGEVTALGFAYRAQKLRNLPVEPWDVPLDAVVTEGGIVRPETG